nr:MAG TPA: hypothetical protein [Caudoviricetes sp.]
MKLSILWHNKYKKSPVLPTPSFLIDYLSTGMLTV